MAAYIRFVKLSITMPIELRQQLDKIAKQQYLNRSGLIRRALDEYIQKYGRDGPADDHVHPESQDEEIPQKLRERILRENPYLDPNDIVLMRILAYHIQQEENE